MAQATPYKILIVEDEEDIAELLAYNLRAQGYEVAIAYDGDEAMAMIWETSPQLILLDWMLPMMSGLDICREIRKNPEQNLIPVMMITARGEESDLIRGFEAGADDYVTKPFSVKEVMARVQAVLRRSYQQYRQEILTHGDLSLDLHQHKITRQKNLIHLSPTEFQILTYLMQRPNKTVERADLIQAVWGEDRDIDLRTVDVCIKRLRQALNIKNLKDPIRTIRGIGYCLSFEE